jgi:hypothetical protein
VSLTLTNAPAFLPPWVIPHLGLSHLWHNWAQTEEESLLQVKMNASCVLRTEVLGSLHWYFVLNIIGPFC